MFQITTKQDIYQTYILSDSESQAMIEVVPSRGGIITAWRLQNLDILYLDKERFAHPELSVRGGIPILFPICGNLPDNLYNHNGKQYSLKQHGFARDLPWQVVKEETKNCASITLVLDSNEDTNKVYPFDFQLVFSYQLQGNSLKIQQRFINLSPERMPFSVGFHPYFAVQDKSQLDFVIPASNYLDQINKQTNYFNGSFDFHQEEIDFAFTTINRHSTSLIDNQRHLNLTIRYSDIFSTLVFWTVLGKDYVCLEPWSAPRNALNTGEQLNYVEPNNSYEALVEIAVNKF